MADSGRSRRGARGIGTLSVGELAGLWAILIVGLILRAAGIGWGLPPATPKVAASGFRGSYAFDEGEILDHLARTDPAKFKLDPNLYNWGTLHLELTLAGLEAAQRMNFFDLPWCQAYRQMQPGGFERTYIAGRFISGIVDLATVFLVFLIGREIAGAAAGLWSAGIIAAAPGHVMLASQIRVDVTATALVMAATLLGVRLATSDSARLAPWMGLAAGLAIAAKYSVAPMAVAVCCASMWPRRKNPRAWMLAGGSMLAGFLIGEPFVLTNTREVMRQMGGLNATGWGNLALVAKQLASLARFSIGLLAATLGVWGLWHVIRVDLRIGRVLLAALGAGGLALFLQDGPMMREHLPLAPLFALGAGCALSGLRRSAQWPLGLLTLTFAMAGSLAQIHYMRSPHAANLALAVIENSAVAGERVSLVSKDIPPLDARVYPDGPNPLKDELSANPPGWVVTTDLPAAGIPEANRDFLANHYQTIAIFRPERIFGWATFGESGSPPDWKYTHPVTTLYRLRR